LGQKGTNFLLNGALDEVRIYNKSLSDSEVKDLYDYGGGLPVEYICGDNIVDPNEKCELPNTINNSLCSQSLSECNGKLYGIRDIFGDCNNVCGCTKDPFVYACVLGECNAECETDDDCGISDCDYKDGCVGKDYYDYNDAQGTCSSGCSCSYECLPPIITKDDERCESPSDIVSYWTMDSISGNILHDEANNNDGSMYNNPSVVGGKIGDALYFDGVNDYVSVPDDSSLDITQAITLSAWFKPSTVNGVHTILGKNNENPWNTNSYTLFQSNKWIYCKMDDSSGKILQPNSGLLNKDQWVHIVCVFDGASTAKLYVNGVLTKTAVNTNFGDIRTSNKNFILGQKGTNFLLNGALDEVRIYNKSLSDSEVKDLYLMN